MRQHSFIKLLRIESAEGTANFEFAVPTGAPTERGTIGAINVICGENAAGKSYIIRSLEGISSEANRRNLYQSGYHIEFTDSSRSPEIVTLEPWKNLSFSGQMFFDKQSDFSKVQDQKLLITVKFWLDIISSYYRTTQSVEIDKSRWMADFQYRVELFEKMDLGDVINALSFFESPFIGQFEQLFECEIGLRKRNRKVKILDITMDTEFGCFAFSNCSQGQKTVFNFLQTINYSDCDVFLIDEIENNLHPKYISKLMRYIKSSGRQFIITSHHPHVIFSRYTDTSLFIERVRPRRSRRGIVYESENKKASIPRRVFPLNEGAAKIRASYLLFDESDADLLQQAGYVKQALHAQVYADIFASMEFEVKPEKKSIFPDGQTSYMAECLNSIDTKGADRLRILDYGSGLCRVAREFRKINAKSSKALEWLLWEPNVEIRSKAKELFPREIAGHFLSQPPEPNSLRGHIDLVLISNVLHELNPGEIAEALACAREIVGQHGYLVVTELYPLLEFEEKAVPLQPEEMKKLLDRSGFDVRIMSSHLRNTTTYVALARCSGRKVADYLQGVEATWRDVLSSRLSGHGTGVRPESALRITERIQEYASVASIAKYFGTTVSNP
jgi:AAA15 family ATPase/GTPase